MEAVTSSWRHRFESFKSRWIAVTLILPAVLLLVGVRLHGSRLAGKESPSDPPEKKSSPEKTTKDGAKKGAEAPKKDDAKDQPIDRVEIERSGYIRRVEAFLEESAKKVDARNATLKAGVIPDYYEYRMALALADLEKRGLHGQELESKMRSAAAENSGIKGKMYFKVSVTTTPKIIKDTRPVTPVDHTCETYLLLRKQRLGDHLLVAQGGQKTYSPVGTNPKLNLKRWKIFDGTGKGKMEQYFDVMQKMEFEVTSGSVKKDGREPITLALDKVYVQTWSPDPNNSINVSALNLSTPRLNELEGKDLKVEFPTASLKPPELPHRFQRLLQILDKGRAAK